VEKDIMDVVVEVEELVLLLEDLVVMEEMV